MFNDFRGFNERGEKVHIAAPPTLLISAIGVMPDVAKAVTLDLKCAGDLVYVIGDTHDELGASEYLYHLGAGIGGRVPSVDTKKNLKAYRALAKAIERDLVASAMSVGRGGLGVALAKTAIAGQLGIAADLSRISGDTRSSDSILFSESQGRIVVSIRPSAQAPFEKVMKGIACTHIGEVTEKMMLDITLPKEHMAIPLTKLVDNYRKPFKNW